MTDHAHELRRYARKTAFGWREYKVVDRHSLK